MKHSSTVVVSGAILAALAGAVFALPSCGNSSVKAIDSGAGGSGTTGAGGAGDTSGVGVTCTVVGAACTSNSECCSQSCAPVSKTCASSVSTCSGAGSSCAVNTDCCNLQCDAAQGVCSSATSCTADNAACTLSAQCCNGTCTGGKCQPLNTTCLTAGNPCTATTGDGGLAGGCCSGLCSGGKCVLGSSFCIQPGDVCSRDLDCCGGLCTISSGATQGTCGDIATTGTGQCTHDGVLCNGCGTCCSRNCGPWAVTGVNVCQPGLGCKIINSLCTTDSECCGNSTGQVSCTLSTSGNMSIGVCSTNTGNQVPGGICKLTGGTALVRMRKATARARSHRRPRAAPSTRWVYHAASARVRATALTRAQVCSAEPIPTAAARQARAATRQPSAAA